MENTGKYTINNRNTYFSKETVERYEQQKESERLQHNKRINKEISKLKDENERIHQTLVRIKNELSQEEKEEFKENIQNLMYREEENYVEIEQLKNRRR